MLCVIGLDYLSTLAYQPSVAFGAAGRLAPLVTVLVAAVTLFLALPVYWYIAGRSPHGGGSTALLERVIPGWFGKLLLLVLLAFGAVDLVFTRTFSAAAAAEHLTHNPLPEWQQTLDAVTREGEALPPATPGLAARTAPTGSWNRQTVVTLDRARARHGRRAGLLQGLHAELRAARGGHGRRRTSLLTLFVVGSGGAYLAEPPALGRAVVGGRVGRELEAGRRGEAGRGLGRAARRVRAAVPGARARAERVRADADGDAARPRPAGRRRRRTPRGVIRNTRILLVVAARHDVARTCSPRRSSRRC